jgi:hypothetical protein
MFWNDIEEIKEKIQCIEKWIQGIDETILQLRMAKQELNDLCQIGDMMREIRCFIASSVESDRSNVIDAIYKSVCYPKEKKSHKRRKRSAKSN